MRTSRRADPDRKEQLLATAQRLMLTKGFAATRVDEICKAAGLTKGAFFHYFDSKDAAGRATVERFARELVQAFQTAPFREKADPLERVYGYVDFTIEICKDAVLRKGCLVGAFSQELSDTHPEIRAVCAQTFVGWAQGLRQHLDDAKALYAPGASIDTRSLAYHFIAVLEGSLVLAKALQRVQIVEESLTHYRRYVQSVFSGGRRVQEGST